MYRITCPKLFNTLCAVGALLALSTATPGHDISYLPAHNEAVSDIGISPSGTKLVSVSFDGRAIIRSLAELESATVIEPVPGTGGLECIAFTDDGARVFVAGDLADFSNMQLQQVIASIDLDTSQIGFVKLQPRSNVMQMSVGDKDARLFYFVINELLSITLKDGRTRQIRRFAGGAEYSGWKPTFSQDARHFALAYRPVDWPETMGRIIVVNDSGERSISHEFTQANDFAGTQIAFVGSSKFVVCEPDEKMYRWELTDSNQWRRSDPPLPIPHGPYTAITSDVQRNQILLASDQTLYALDANTGKVLHRIQLNVPGFDYEDYPDAGAPITCVAVSHQQPSLIAAGLWDGRIAIVRKSEER